MTELSGLERKYADFESRSKKLMPLFKMTSFIHKHRIFRPFIYIPTPFIYQWAHLLGPLVLKKKRLQKQIYKGLDALYPNNMLNSKQKKKLYHANAIYMGILYLDAMFHSSNLYPKTLNHFVQFENLRFIYDALKKGKGAIIPTLHVGMFFQVLGSMTYIRPKINITTVIQPRNRVMYENILSRPELTNFHVVNSTSFKELGPILAERLAKNHLIIVYYDYSRAHQLRVPFESGRYPYLITTPQSIFLLHKIHKSPIIPALLSPNKEFGISKIKYLDPNPLFQVSNKYWNESSKIFLGEMSIKLNQIFAPHLRKYNHIWEEFRKFSTRCSDSFEIEANWTNNDLIKSIQQKIINLLDQSYESNRDDKKILEMVDTIIKILRKELDDPILDTIVKPNLIDLSFKSANQEIITLLNSLIHNFRSNLDETLILEINEKMSQIEDFKN